MEYGILVDETKYRRMIGSLLYLTASDKEDRKSTRGTCQLLGKTLIFWNSKKQASVALSTTEAEYIAIGQCYAQLLWMSHQLVHHYRAKHIDIKHHFIRDHCVN
ncbi:secreted RxLR effector protein 161-like [Nicotiana sylvestris]|uniref:secreted RxLR effector protein 161-like n=1 Tax=Nicotiana sylvestris TaxID=4096 RepID=UPI00388C7743